MLNKVILIGRITKEISLMRTNTNRDYTRFTLAVNRRSQNGEQNADFISCIAWNKTAVTMHDYLRKGALIAIEGRLNTGSYEKNGERIYTTDVIVENFHFLESKKDSESQNATSYTNASQTTNEPYEASTELDIADEELPF